MNVYQTAGGPVRFQHRLVNAVNPWSDTFKVALAWTSELSLVVATSDAATDDWDQVYVFQF